MGAGASSMPEGSISMQQPGDLGNEPNAATLRKGLLPPPPAEPLLIDFGDFDDVANESSKPSSQPAASSGVDTAELLSVLLDYNVDSGEKGSCNSGVKDGRQADLSSGGKDGKQAEINSGGNDGRQAVLSGLHDGRLHDGSVGALGCGLHGPRSSFVARDGVEEPLLVDLLGLSTATTGGAVPAPQHGQTQTVAQGAMHGAAHGATNGSIQGAIHEEVQGATTEIGKVLEMTSEVKALLQCVLKDLRYYCNGGGREDVLSTKAVALLRSLCPQFEGALWMEALLLSGEGDIACIEAKYVSCREQADWLRERRRVDRDGSYRRWNARVYDDLDVIDEDVPRTFIEQGHGYRSSTSVELTEVLEAHVVAEARLGSSGMGYVQGMADVAGYLLQRLAPWQAFGCLRTLCARPLVRMFCRLNVDEWLLISSVFSSLLGLCCPTLFTKLTEWQLEPVMYLPEWLLPLWTRSVRPDVASYIFALLIVEGDDTILIRSALAVCSAIEPQLLKCDDMPSCRKLLSESPSGVSLETFAQMLQHCAVGDDVLAPLMRTPKPLAAADDTC